MAKLISQAEAAQLMGTLPGRTFAPQVLDLSEEWSAIAWKWMRDTTEAQRKHQRHGQAVYNACPLPYASDLAGTLDDCFYVDDRIWQFVEQVYNMWLEAVTDPS